MKDCFYKVVFCFLVLVLIGHSAGAQLAATVDVNNTTCGQNNGSAEIYPSGGAGYTYAWSIAGIGSTDTVSGLSPGLYSVTITSGGSSIVKSFNVANSTPPANLDGVIQPTCGRNNGTIDCSTTSSSNFQTTLLRNDTLVEQGSQTQFVGTLAPGIYSFIVSDASTGCIDTITPIVLSDTSSFPIISSVIVTQEHCYGDSNGAIYVTVTNCVGGCVYSWGSNTTNHTDSAVRIPAGVDTFSVSGGGCTNIDTIITVPGPLAAFTNKLTTSPDHCGKHDGVAIDSISGGTAPFVFTWSQGISSGDSSTRLVGDSSLQLTVTDAHGCMIYDSVYIGTTPKPGAYIATPVDTICESDNTGILQVVVVPKTGVSPFTYLWSNAQRTNVDAGLPPGLYSVLVTDSVGCDTLVYGTVPAYPGQLSASFIPSSGVVLGQTLQIQLNTDVTPTDVVWSPYIQRSRGNLDVSFVPTTSDSVYTVIVSYGNACKLYDTLHISVDTDLYAGKWVIPNTFTPNGDHVNDYFLIITAPELSFFHIYIYDRWGNKVYESTDAGFNWDGKDQFTGDTPLNDGVYAYVIQYQAIGSDSKGTIGGNISLVK